jgi:plasmid stabilization system protein ParE
VRFDPWVVFYRVGHNAIEIVRVLDERRDVDVIFTDDA